VKRLSESLSQKVKLPNKSAYNMPAW